MNKNEFQLTVNVIFDNLEKLIPVYRLDPAENTSANGNVAVCIIDENGQVYGKMFGTNNAKLRETYQVAWTKASQVWLTGVKTGEYERMVFNDEVDPMASGIRVPDLIGWKGGQPLTLQNGTKLWVGFSGFRGITDLEIMVKALAKAEQELSFI